MAEGGEDLFSVSLEKLDGELTCPVCTEHFKEPRVLPCLHYYCKTCIADLIKRAKGRPFNCPECRREAQAAGNDPESFPTAFFVNRMEEVFSVMKKAEPKENFKCESCSQFPAVNFCRDCSEYICTKCTDAHKRMRLLSSHKVVSINSLRSTISKSAPENLRVMSREVKCSKHADEPLKLYCRECHKLVCRDCIVIDHKDHTYAFVIDAAPRCKAEMKEKAESVKKISVGLKSAVKSLSDSEKRLIEHGTSTERAIDDVIDRVIAKAGQKRKELKEKASRMVSEARKNVSTQEKNAELAVGEVESLLEFMGRSLERATDQEVLSLEKQVSDQVERVSQLYGNPAGKFPVPELPELVVRCGAGVEQVIESEISVAKKDKLQTSAVSIDDERIGFLQKSQVRFLLREARNMQLFLQIDCNLNIIDLKGSKESIADMKLKLKDTLDQIEKERYRKTQAETMRKTVQWRRQDSNDTDYDPITNLEIEEKYHGSGGKSTYTFKSDFSEEHFTIHFRKMIEIDHAMRDKTYKVKRVTIGTAGDGLPDYWEPMIDPVSGRGASKNEVPLRVVDLSCDSKEYQFALAEFNKTMTQGTNYTAIVKIQRIQNPALYGQYIAKKRSLDSHNLKGVQNERWLFHGTNEYAISHINQTNFNRSLRGQNGTVHGQGCYFARDASYSNRYASLDSQQHKHMYLVRVLTGKFTQGVNAMVIPPPKDPKDPTVPYDSVVDNPSNPTIYVVFYDAHAYPEYLIAYT